MRLKISEIEIESGSASESESESASESERGAIESESESVIAIVIEIENAIESVIESCSRSDHVMEGIHSRSGKIMKEGNEEKGTN